MKYMNKNVVCYIIVGVLLCVIIWSVLILMHDRKDKTTTANSFTYSIAEESKESAEESTTEFSYAPIEMFRPSRPSHQMIEYVSYDNSEELEESDETSRALLEGTGEEDFYSAEWFKYRGVIYWGGWRWTWYSERVLPGGGLKIPGRHSDENGYICDEDDYICLASSVLSKGTVVATPFGKKGKVYDSGCAPGSLDVYVNW